jgi:hypothetical protein
VVGTERPRRRIEITAYPIGTACPRGLEDGPSVEDCPATEEAAPLAIKENEHTGDRGDMAVKRLVAWVGLVVLTLGLVACESERERYFRKHVNQISQDAVARRFGPPHRAQELRDGGTVWSYEYRDRSDCTIYILRFDQMQVLRDWKEEEC